MQLDNDLSLPPFVPITDADLEFAAADPDQWTEGPYLHKRTVTVPDWEQQ